MSRMVPLKSWWGKESLWLTLLTQLHIQIVWLTAASQRFSGNPTEMIRVHAISRIVWMVLSDLAFPLGLYGAQYVTSVPSSWYMVFITLDFLVDVCVHERSESLKSWTSFLMTMLADCLG